MARTRWIRWALVLGGCLLGACQSPGPGTLRQGQLAYNDAVRRTVDEELLLNIVRLRYDDTIEFLSASSISSQTVLRASFGADVASLGQDDLARVAGDVGYERRPTFTFTPQRGAEFARRLMGPVDLKTLTYLAASNWDLDVLMRTFVSEINGIPNEVGGGERARFVEVTRLLGALQDQNRVVVGLVEEQNPVSLPIEAKAVSPRDYLDAAEKGYRYVEGIGGEVVHLAKIEMQPAVLIPPGTAEGRELVRLLSLEPGPRPYFAIDVGARVTDADRSKHDILVRTRSLLTAMAFLAQGVHVPQGDVESGVATPDWPVRGARADKLRDTFQVRWCGTRPPASLAVPYRGHWFTIDDCDHRSKTAFLLLATLYRLKISGEVTRDAPVLTLPVG